MFEYYVQKSASPSLHTINQGMLIVAFFGDGILELCISHLTTEKMFTYLDRGGGECALYMQVAWAVLQGCKNPRISTHSSTTFSPWMRSRSLQCI